MVDYQEKVATVSADTSTGVMKVFTKLMGTLPYMYIYIYLLILKEEDFKTLRNWYKNEKAIPIYVYVYHVKVLIFLMCPLNI